MTAWARTTMVLAVVAAAGTFTVTGTEPEEGLAGCAEAQSAADPWQALETCRAELEMRPDDAALVRAVAALEYEEGDPDASAALWARLEELEGRSLETELGRGAALWRAGRVEEAEAVLRDAVERSGATEAAVDLVELLLEHQRWEDAAAAASEAIEGAPATCRLYELRGLAAAGEGDDEAAAADFARAAQRGCPPYRWATLGVLPERVDADPYRRLLDPAELTDGLGAVDDAECELRLRLLDLVLAPSAAPAITDVVAGRDRLELRYAGLGLLEELGPAAVESWRRLLADDDFVLRKLVLRRIREQRDPVYREVLERHLERGDAPGNMALTRLALGELMLDVGERGRAEALLGAIPADDPLYALGRISLADSAEAAGELAAALRYLEQAQVADPEVHVQLGRVDKLRSAVEAGAGS